jgi:hypothetical protein
VGSSLILTGNRFWADIGVAALLVAVTAPATTALERQRAHRTAGSRFDASSARCYARRLSAGSTEQWTLSLPPPSSVSVKYTSLASGRPVR